MQVRFALPLALLAGALAACSQSQPPATQSPDTASAASTPADAPAPADATPAQDASAPAPDAGAAQPASVAGSCSTEVDANDNMQYSTKAIDIPASCTDYAITGVTTTSTVSATFFAPASNVRAKVRKGT